MKILNVDFSEKIEWTETAVLEVLKNTNPDKTEKELKSLIKASKLVKNELQTNTSKSDKRKKSSEPNDRDINNI